MNTYLRAAAVTAALIAGTYGLLLIAAGAAPAPTTVDQTSQSTLVADQLQAEAQLLAHPGRQSTEPLQAR